MKKIGITGHNGFIGYHLYTHTKYFEEDYEPIKLSPNLSPSKLADNFDDDCDVIIHLGEKNKNNKGLSDEVIYENNRNSTKTLISSLKSRGRKNMRIFYASSTHEDDDTLYGKYRRENKKDFQEWAERSDSVFSSLRIPNVFGPFCQPNYNSFIATFCHKIINGEELTVNTSPVNLIYVRNLCKQIIDIIRDDKGEDSYRIKPDTNCTVNYVYSKLLGFKDEYIDNNIIPILEDTFDVDLFNTFRSYIDDKLITMESHSDERGYLSETIKTNAGGQSFFSTTMPGYTRGQHFHIRKLERFCVLKGNAIIKLRKINDVNNEVITYNVSGDKTQFIDMPLYYTHNITPADDKEIVTLFWTNELLDKNDADTFWEDV